MHELVRRLSVCITAGTGGTGKTDTATSRRAVQAAAGALALACPCDKIVMCAVLTPPDQLAQVLYLLALNKQTCDRDVTRMKLQFSIWC